MHRFIFFLIPLFFISCQEKANEEQIKKTLIRSLEQSFYECSQNQDYINKQFILVTLMKVDSALRYRVYDYEPSMFQIKHYGDEVENELIDDMNLLLKNNNNDSIRFYREISGHVLSSRAFSEINNPLHYDQSNKFFLEDLKSKTYKNRAHKIRVLLKDYRDKIISTVIEYTTDSISLNKEQLSNIDSLKNKMNSIKYRYQYKIEQIYYRLTKSEYIAYDGEAIKWEEARFKNVPLIHCITEIINLRKDILFAQSEVYEILFSELEKKILVDKQNQTTTPSTN